MTQTVKNPPAMSETQVQSLDREEPRDEETTTYSRVLSWEIPWTEEPGENGYMYMDSCVP